MAKSSEQSETVGGKLQKGTPVHEAWEEHQKQYDTQSEALRSALRDSLVSSKGGRSYHPAVKITTAALLGGALAALIGQSFVVWDVWVATGLTALTLYVIGIIAIWNGSE